MMVPFHSGLFDITIIVMIIIISVPLNISLCYKFCSLSNKLLAKWTYPYRKTKQK